jgi:hypothetical protein
MLGIYNQIHLSEMGTLSSYQSAFKATGFVSVSFMDHSSNIAVHYGSVLEVLKETNSNIRQTLK